MSAAPSRPGLAKELRALLVPWLLVMAAVALTGVTRDFLALQVAMVGAVGLGAWSVGHEYSYRTLPLLLAQPRDRRGMWLDKIAVLAALLTGLFLLGAGFLQKPGVGGTILFRAFVAVGLTVVPWLTMVARSARGGVIFTIAALLMGYIAVTWAGEFIAVRYPDAWPDPKLFAQRAVVFSLFALIAATAALGWRMFGGLSAIDERTEHLTLPDTWRRRAPRDLGLLRSRRGRWFVALLRKELSLQVPVLILAVIYVLTWIGRWTLSEAGARETLEITAAFLYGFTVPVLAGALASAEERRLGTWDAQLLQPPSARIQWFLKVLVVLTVAVGCAIALPVLLSLAEASIVGYRDARLRFQFGSEFYLTDTKMWTTLLVVLLAALGLYASSLSRNAVHALLATIGTGVVATAAWTFVDAQLSRAQARLLENLVVQTRSTLGSNVSAWRQIRDQVQALDWMLTATVILTGVAVAALLVVFAGENHRVADRRPRRLAVQIIVLAGLPVVALIAMRALPVWFLGR